MDKRCKTLVRSRVPKLVFSKMEKWDWSEVTENAMITVSGSGSDWKVLTKFREFGQKMCRVRCRQAPSLYRHERNKKSKFLCPFRSLVPHQTINLLFWYSPIYPQVGSSTIHRSGQYLPAKSSCFL